MNKLFLKKIGLSFARAFLGVLIPGLAGVYSSFVSGDVPAARAALIALVAAGGAAVLKSAQIAWTTWESK